jgi:putative hydrolase of the HAD superfamily
MASSQIRAVTFDLDDTLWDIWPIVERAEQRLHAWLEDRYPRLTVAFTALELRELARRIGEQRPEIAHDRTALRLEALTLAADQVGYRSFHAEAAFQVFFAARNDVVFFDEVLPVLERLAQRYTLGALSNGNADIRLVGLAKLFDFAINAVDVGVSKPAPDMFVAACRHLDLEPAQIVHVGDDPEHDVMGAARVGMRTIWVNRDSKPWPGGRRADAEIVDFEQLEQTLSGLE